MSKRKSQEDAEDQSNKKFKVNYDECDREKYIELKQIVKEVCVQQHIYYHWCQRGKEFSSNSILPSSSKDEPSSSSKVSVLIEESNDKDSKKGLEEKCNDIAADEIDENRPNLLNLSDDVLLNIFKYLHPFDLLNLSSTCQRLNGVCRDRTLWIDVDFRFNTLEERYMKTRIDYDDFLDFILPNTRSVKKSGSTTVQYAEYACTANKTTQVSITPKFIQDLSKKAKNLESLTIENHILYGPSISLDCFPGTLKHLSFKNSLFFRIPNEKSYFYQIDKLLPNLSVLDLTGCQWFRAHSFLALSKSKTLKELHLKGCLGIEDCVPYASLASTFGFPSLELLDLRLTHVRDSDVSCFNRVEKLKKLYLEALDWLGAEGKISDIGVSSFGSQRETLHENHGMFVLIRKQRQCQSSLETLVLRNYPLITDISLKHAALCLPNLKYLDVRGTCCTESGVNNFKNARPDVEILTNFGNNAIEESAL